MKPIRIKETDLNAQIATAGASAVTSIAFYFIGQHLEKVTGKKDIKTPALILGGVAGPLLLKAVFK